MKKEDLSASAQKHSYPPLAIVGIACRFPGANNAAEFWELLKTPQSVIQKMNESRLRNNTRRIDEGADLQDIWWGRLENIDHFDPYFFNISPREATKMDPQQRLCLQVAVESIDDAGYRPTLSEKKDTGVIVAAIDNEYQKLSMRDPNADVISVTGFCRSAIAGRISHAMNFNGPSLTIDSDRSSSLVAIHLAAQSLHSGECSAFLVGGVNLILDSSTSEAFHRSGMLSTEGKCRFADASAQGFIRSEGVAFLVIKTLEKALADNDRIYAEIIGSSVINQGRRFADIKVPDHQMEKEVIQRAMERAGVRADEICFIEAHGTATPSGDRAELRAIGAIMEPSGRNEPCWIDSVKSKIGHTESAAGLAGLIKAILCLSNHEIPGNTTFHSPPNDVDLNQLKIAVPTQKVSLKLKEKYIAGVNSFGLTGTLSHVLIRTSNRQRGLKSHETNQVAKSHLLFLSAKTEKSLLKNAGKYIDFLKAQQDLSSQGQAHASLRDICYTAGLRRPYFDHRIAIQGSSFAEMCEGLKSYIKHEKHKRLVTPEKKLTSRKIAFIYHGLSLPDVKDLELLLLDKEFSHYFTEIDLEFEKLFNRKIWRPGHPLTSPQETNVLGVALSIAISNFWKSRGLIPQATLGCGYGEIAAAHISGLISLQEALAIANATAPVSVGPESVNSKNRPYEIHFFSNSQHKMLFQSDLDQSYWANLHNDDEFSDEIIRAVASHGIDIFVQSSPGLAGSHSDPSNYFDISSEQIWIGPFNGGFQNYSDQIQNGWAQLFVYQAVVNWQNVLDLGSVVGLPPYSWESESFWIKEIPHWENYLSNEKDASQMIFDSLEKFIERLCHEINRYMGPRILAPINMNESFRQQGIDGPPIAGLIEHLSQVFDVKLSPRCFVEYPMVRELAVHIYTLISSSPSYQRSNHNLIESPEAVRDRIVKLRKTG